MTIFAGSHTFQTLPAALQVYRELGIDEKRLQRESRKSSLAVLPILTHDRMRLITKTNLSPFEQTTTYASPRTPPDISPIPLALIRKRPSILPLLCSEALQTHNVSSRYTLAAILSYQSRPSRFEAFIDAQIHNHHPVAYCNDGRFGGSGVFTIRDDRNPDWFRDFISSLPPEDAFLVMDVNLTQTAVQVGTVAPQKSEHLVSLGSFIYS